VVGNPCFHRGSFFLNYNLGRESFNSQFHDAEDASGKERLVLHVSNNYGKLRRGITSKTN
jgi:hypothetical protein